MVKLIPYHSNLDQGLRDLFSLPVSGDIRLSLNRDPSYFTGAGVQTEDPVIFVAVEGQKVVGVFNMGKKRVYLHGEIVKVTYLCDLRIHPDYQKSSLLLRMIRLMGKELMHAKTYPALTAVFADNGKMIAMIKKRFNMEKYPSLPYYHKVADLITFVLKPQTVYKAADINYKVRRARSGDIHLMQAIQDRVGKFQPYHPYYDFRQIGSKGFYKGLDIENYFLAFEGQNLVGMAGYWDQRGFKQTFIRGYSRTMKLIRPIYNTLAAKCFGFPELPAVGEQLHGGSVHTIILEGRNGLVFGALISSIARDFSNKNLLITLDRRDPLSAYFHRIKKKISKHGAMYLVNFDKQLQEDLKADLFFFDTGRI